MIWEGVRAFTAILNGFVCFYALFSASRMSSPGSVAGRVALAAYSFAFGVGQVELLRTPPSIRTWLALLASICGIIWFIVEYRSIQREKLDHTSESDLDHFED